MSSCKHHSKEETAGQGHHVCGHEEAECGFFEAPALSHASQDAPKQTTSIRKWCSLQLELFHPSSSLLIKNI